MTRPSWPGLLRDAFQATALDEDVIKDARRHRRRGLVRSVASTPGVLAGVVADGAEIRHVTWQVVPLAEAGWRDVEQEIQTSPLVMAMLLERLPPTGTPDLNATMAALVPDPADLEATCDCEDWLVPCAHALAVGLTFAESTRDDAWSLLRLRGRTHDWLVAAEASARARQLLAQLVR
ncbi:SWIM zinc finger family protein [Micromonospora endophytica]|uniref:SWIM-type domain-containing protein n=1 Tax=Micromonospora endophytica TaxID=515350 RepID=A0A2W2CHH7_9ACTN|nr:SWIM zinc finger family protein [Micromonospora endophytica]PZF87729.1 hypothetical protein C1I93_25870 [Micromonospora endophytica]RIW44622.1 hypothetical protein D3H59_16985 [Micromonospora endophytica]